MTNQQGAPEALRPDMLDDLIETFTTAGLGRHNLMRVELPRHQWAQLAVALSRLHAENERLAALVEAQQPAAHVQNPVEVEHVAGDVSKNGAESNMAYAELPEQVGWRDSTYHCDLYYDPPYRDGLAPLFTADQMRAFADATHAIRTQRPSPTPQADSQPAPVLGEPTWTVFNSGAQVAEVESLAEAMEYLTPERLSRQWCAVCVVDQANMPKARAPADSAPTSVEETMTFQEVWEAAGGNPGIRPTRSDVLLALKILDEVCDEAQADSVTAPAGAAVAYLDIGAGGYLDLGTDLSNEALSRLPKGRHALVIAGTYGIDGYTPTPPTQAADSVLEDAARLLESQHTWLTNVAAAKLVRSLAARKQGGAT